MSAAPESFAWAERFVALIQAAARARAIARLSCVSAYGTEVFWRRFGFTADRSPALAACLTGYGESAKYMVATLNAAR